MLTINWQVRGMCRCLWSHVVCASARVWSLPGGLLPSQHRRRSIVFRVLFQQTNKWINKESFFPTQETEYRFSGFIPTNKQTNRSQTGWRRRRRTKGVLHHSSMKDPPSKIWSGPQRAVAGAGTSKSGGGTGKAILSSSLTQVNLLLVTSSCPRRPNP